MLLQEGVFLNDDLKFTVRINYLFKKVLFNKTPDNKCTSTLNARIPLHDLLL